jgi:hypothetical protein
MIKITSKLNDIVVLLYLNFFLKRLPFDFNFPISFNYMVILFLLIINFFNNKSKILYVNKNLGILLAILFISFMSLFYTNNIKDGLQQFIGLAAIFVLLGKYIYPKINEQYIREILFHSFIIGGVYIISSLVFFDSYLLKYQLYGFQYFFEGFEYHRHNVAAIITFYLMLIYSYIKVYRKNRVFSFFLFIIALFLIYHTHTRIGYFMLFVYFFIIYSIYFKYEIKLLNKLIICMICLFSFISLSFYFDEIYNRFYTLQYMIERGFTHRDENILLFFSNLSEYTILLISGMGLGSIDVYDKTVLNWSPRDVPSSIIVFYELGLMGFMVWTFFIIRYIKSLMILYKHEIYRNYFSFFCIPLVIILIPSEGIFVHYSGVITIVSYFIMLATIKFEDKKYEFIKDR